MEGLNVKGVESECRALLACSLATEKEANALLRRRRRRFQKLSLSPGSPADWMAAIIGETELLVFIRTRRERIRYFGRVEAIDRPLARRIDALYATVRANIGKPGDYLWNAHYGFLCAVDWKKERRKVLEEWIASDPLNPDVWIGAALRELGLLGQPGRNALDVLGEASAVFRAAAKRLPGCMDVLLNQLTLELRYLVAARRAVLPPNAPAELLAVREGEVAKRVLKEAVDCAGNSSFADQTLLVLLVRHPADCQQKVLLFEYMRLRGNAVDAWHAFARACYEDKGPAALPKKVDDFCKIYQTGLKITKSRSLVKLFLYAISVILRDLAPGSVDRAAAAEGAAAVAATARKLKLFSKDDEVLFGCLVRAPPRNKSLGSPPSPTFSLDFDLALK